MPYIQIFKSIKALFPSIKKPHCIKEILESGVNANSEQNLYSWIYCILKAVSFYHFKGNNANSTQQKMSFL